jgi:hypothetical protein
MQACPGCGLSLDDATGFCPTCGWRPGAAAGGAGGAPQPAQTAAVGPVGRPRPTGDRSGSGFDLWSLPKWLWAIPVVTVLLAAHVAFPHLPWSRYAVRFGNTWETGGLRLAAGICVLLAGIGLTVLLAWLTGRGRKGGTLL